MLLRLAMAALAAALLAPLDAASQLYRPERLHPADGGPSLTLMLSSSGVHAINTEFDDDFRALDAFNGGKRGIDRFPRGYEANGGWKLYGRFYLVNFQNNLDQRESATKFSWRRSGPKIAGSRIFIAVHRKF